MALPIASCQSPMPTAYLTDRALVSVSGPEAEHFLQNIITTDLDALGARRGEARRAAVAARQDPVRFPGLARSGADGFIWNAAPTLPTISCAG